MCASKTWPARNWGTERYDVVAEYNGLPSAAMAVRQAAGANALETANAVRKKMEEMSRYFPPGMKVIYPYDTTPLYFSCH